METIAARSAKLAGSRSFCAVCRVNRVNGLSAYCTQHKHNFLKYGSPTGRAIKKSETWEDLKACRRFMRLNRGHPLVVDRVAMMNRQLTDAVAFAAQHTETSKTHWKHRIQFEIARLAYQGVTGREIIEAAASTYVFARHRSAILSPTGKPLHFAVARAVFSLAPRFKVESTRRSDRTTRKITRRFSVPVLNHHGEDLVSTLMPLLIAIARSVERRRAAQSLNQERQPTYDHRSQDA